MVCIKAYERVQKHVLDKGTVSMSSQGGSEGDQNMYQRKISKEEKLLLLLRLLLELIFLEVF